VIPAVEALTLAEALVRPIREHGQTVGVVHPNYLHARQTATAP
jgi:hypothetical protein